MTIQKFLDVGKLVLSTVFDLFLPVILTSVRSWATTRATATTTAATATTRATTTTAAVPKYVGRH